MSDFLTIEGFETGKSQCTQGILKKQKANKKTTRLLPKWFNLLLTCWSGREDLNLRPPAPKAGALTSLRYAPSQNRLPVTQGPRKSN